MDFKKIWRNMAEIDPPVGILTFFKQALVSQNMMYDIDTTYLVLTIIQPASKATLFSKGLLFRLFEGNCPLFRCASGAIIRPKLRNGGFLNRKGVPV